MRSRSAGSRLERSSGMGSTNQSSGQQMTTIERTVNWRLHVTWEAESSERLYAARRTQDACWNLALEFLIENPAEPLRKARRLRRI